MLILLQGELFKETKVRLSKRIGIKGKQFDKMKFAIVQRSMYSKSMYLSDGKLSFDFRTPRLRLTDDYYRGHTRRRGFQPR